MAELRVEPDTAWTSSTHPSHGPSKQVEMVSFGMDPQWGGLLFSLCSRHEDPGAVLGAGGGLLFSNVLSDPLATSAAGPGLVSVAGAGHGCLDLYSVSSVWAIIVQTAKATGMVVLLGVGSVLCYRVYHAVWPRVRRRLKQGLRRASGTPPAVRRPRARPQSVSSAASGAESDASDAEASSDEEDVVAASSTARRASAHHFHRAAAEAAEVTGMYFGPVPDNTGGCLPRNGTRGPTVRRTRRRSQHNYMGRDAQSLDEEARDADVSGSSTPPELRAGSYRGGSGGYRTGSAGWWRGATPNGPNRGPRGWRGNGTSSSSSSLSPEYPPHNKHQGSRRHAAQVPPPPQPDPRPRELVMLRRDDSADSLARRFMTRDESFESLSSYLHGQRRSDSDEELLLLRPRRSNGQDDADLDLLSPASVVFTLGSDDDNAEAPPSQPAPPNISDPLPPALGSTDDNVNALLDADPAKDVIFQRFMSSPSCPVLRRAGHSCRSVDSLGFPRRGLTRGSSFDSTCSELSLDASLIAELEAQGEAAANAPNPTLACLEQLQREIEQLKHNCLSLDEEFETFKCNRNVPGMSSLLEAKGDAPAAGAGDLEEERARAARARACFAGLYTLTRITSSPSLDLSDCQPSSLESVETPPHHKLRAVPATVSEDCEEAPASLEWDEELEAAGVGVGVDEVGVDEVGAEIMTRPRAVACLATLGSLGESMDLGASAATMLEHSQLAHSIQDERLEASCVSLRDSDSLLTSSVATFELDLESELGDMVAPIPELELEQEQEHSSKQSPTTPDSWAPCDGILTRSSSSSGVSVLSRSLSGLSDAWSSAQPPNQPPAQPPAQPTSQPQAQPVLAIGPRISIQEYARREWQGDTNKAQTILKGYSEIPGLLGLNAVRVVRGDNYCSVRGALFQALSRALPLPLGRQAATRCAQILTQPSGDWLRSWSFAGRLPYSGVDVEDGIRDCLLSLDSTVERLNSASDRESALTNMLNADPWLDSRLCEAAKLLMLVSAIDLRDAADRGQPLPLFAELLFARDSSSTPRDFMNNHLRHVGDTGGLEQVEMYLLGYSLGIRIRVVRPSAFGSQDFVSSYPDYEDVDFDSYRQTDNEKLVDLVAEDDRHYNILVQ